MIQLVKNYPLTFRVKIREYEFVKPKYLMPVGSLKLIEAKIKGSTMVWNIEGGIVSYNQIKKLLKK